MQKLMFDSKGSQTNNRQEAVAINNNGSCKILASHNGDLFDPLDRFTLYNHKDTDRGGPKFSLQNCKFTCFHLYLKYLRNKNRANFTKAQRSFLDG